MWQTGLVKADMCNTPFAVGYAITDCLSCCTTKAQTDKAEIACAAAVAAALTLKSQCRLFHCQPAEWVICRPMQDYNVLIAQHQSTGSKGDLEWPMTATHSDQTLLEAAP